MRVLTRRCQSCPLAALLSVGKVASTSSHQCDDPVATRNRHRTWVRLVGGVRALLHLPIRRYNSRGVRRRANCRIHGANIQHLTGRGDQVVPTPGIRANQPLVDLLMVRRPRRATGGEGRARPQVASARASRRTVLRRLRPSARLLSSSTCAQVQSSDCPSGLEFRQVSFRHAQHVYGRYGGCARPGTALAGSGPTTQTSGSAAW
jgi:hypothetical protein